MRLLAVAALLLASPAFAQSSDDDDQPAATTKAQPPSKADTEEGNLNVNEKGGAEGGYKGVAPGAQALPPHPPKLPLRKGPQRMTWPGFQVKDGVPTVFLEVT